jgi:hypothetical protein
MIGPFDLVAFYEGTIEHRHPDVDHWLSLESEGQPGDIMNLTGTWRKLDQTLVGLILHVFDLSLALAYVDGSVRAFICEEGKHRVLRVGSSGGELL